MSRTWYPGSITLSKLEKAFVTTKTAKDGSKVKCLLIPMEMNHITEFKNENGVKLDLHIRVGMSDEVDDKKQIAMITHSISSKEYKAATDEQKEGFKNLPILGNLFDFGEGSNPAESIIEIDESEDLPF